MVEMITVHVEASKELLQYITTNTFWGFYLSIKILATATT